MVEVFDSFDSQISIALEGFTTSSFVVSNGETINIDNTGGRAYSSVFTITTDVETVLSGEIVVNNEGERQGFGFTQDVTLGIGDVLVLDFKEQNYTFNGVSIIDKVDFIDNNLLVIEQNSINSLSFTLPNDINLDIQTLSYSALSTLHYLEGFNLQSDVSYKTVESFNTLSPNQHYKQGVSHSFSINQMATDWEFYNHINSDSVYRIKYVEFNPDTAITETKYLIGVKFDGWKRDLRMGDFIMTNVDGLAQELI